MSFTPGCGNCVRRAYLDGGRGDCPMARPAVLESARAWPLFVERQRVCSNWKPGDRRERPVAAAPAEGLF